MDATDKGARGTKRKREIETLRNVRASLEAVDTLLVAITRDYEMLHKDYQNAASLNARWAAILGKPEFGKLE